MTELNYVIETTLIIEDDAVTSFLNQLLVDDLKFSKKVISALDGTEALEILEQQDQVPELIFLDIKMPGMDGFEFLETFKHLYPKHDGRIVILTSSVDNRDQVTAKNYNVYKYLQKPLSTRKIEEILEELFEFKNVR